MRLHEDMAETCGRLAQSLAKMADELQETAKETERNRKQWKEVVVKQEKAVYDSETAMRKVLSELSCILGLIHARHTTKQNL